MKIDIGHTLYVPNVYFTAVNIIIYYTIIDTSIQKYNFIKKGWCKCMHYDQKLMDKMADNIENYVDIIKNYVIIEGITEEEYKSAKKTVKKLIKKLREGDGDAVFDRERYIEALESGKLDNI